MCNQGNFGYDGGMTNAAVFTPVRASAVSTGDQMPFTSAGVLVTNRKQAEALHAADAITWKTVEERWTPISAADRIEFTDGTSVDVSHNARVLTRTPDEAHVTRETVYGIEDGGTVAEEFTCRGDAVVANQARELPGVIVFKEILTFADRVEHTDWMTRSGN
jgi:hypothetical protein